MVFRFLSQIALGNALTKLTNVFEELQHSKKVMPVGAGGGIDSLPIRRQQEIINKMPKWLDTLRKHPRHVVTRELIKNMLISEKLGEVGRIEIQFTLLEYLVENDVAISDDEFKKSDMD
ncbi:hypothetical protein [Serratia proteamaculans]